MTDSFYNAAGPFTMVSHLLAQEVGLVCAAVYGAVWKKCQLEDGVCKASLDTLGSEIHIDRATVMRSIKKLCELGYLLDQTPGRRNAPHTYILAKSVAQCNSSEDTTVVMRNSPEGETVADDNKSVAYNNSSMADEAQGGKTVAESHLKRISSPLESLKDNPNSSPYGEGGKPPPTKEPLPVTENEQPIPADPPPESAKPKKVRAPKPPAFQVYTDKTEYYSVTKEWVEKMVQIVGEKPEDLTRWGDTITTFTGRGKWKGNVQDMLDWYQNGIPDYSKKASTNGTHQRHNQQPTGESLEGEPTFDPYSGEIVPGRGS